MELLFPLSASPPRPLMSPFPVLSHNPLENCAHMGLLWTSWVGWHEVIFPTSVLHEKTSVVQAWRAEAKVCKGCSERNDSLIPEETKVEFRWWQMMLAAFENRGDNLLIPTSITANMSCLYITIVRWYCLIVSLCRSWLVKLQKNSSKTPWKLLLRAAS